MAFMKKYRFSLAALAVVILTIAGYWSLPEMSSSDLRSSETPAGTTVPANGLKPKPRAVDAATNLSHSGRPQSAADLSLPPAIRELAALKAAPVLLRDGGSVREFQLSTTEVFLRGRDGAQKIVSLPASDSPQAFAAALERLRLQEGVEPELVLYPGGFPQNEFTQRIVTREVVITAPSRAEADALASSQGLIFKKSPVFAPNAFVYEAPTAVQALSVQVAQSGVIEATPLLASLTSKRVMPNDQLIQKQWHLRYQGQRGSLADTDVNVESVWKYPKTTAFVYGSGNATTDYIRGNNVTIGIVDDGLQWSHPDLLPNVIKALQYDWNGRDNNPKPSSGDDHGTACAGVAAARGNNKIGVSGVAPEANLVGMRLIAGVNTDLDKAEAMTWQPAEIEILSNSWGPPDDGSKLEGPGLLTLDALKYAATFGRGGLGTIITFAGGNGRADGDNSNYDGYANSIYTIAVAAMDSQGGQASYSESGANIVITAPSDGDAPALGILTTDNKGGFGYNPGFQAGDLQGHPNNTETFGGTSSATPAVSGVIALMLQRNPNLGWRDVQEILMRSAAQVDATDADWITANRTDHLTGNATVPFHFNHKYGAGLVDATAAVTMSGNWTNLGPQKFQTVSTNLTTPIDATGSANATITRTFTVNGTNLRAEHATLALTITDIPKGDLTITLTSPGNTTSTLCEPHSDTTNTFTNWKFMTVRNWAESSNGTWTLTISNNGTTTGNLTDAELVVYGSELGSTANPAPLVEAKSSHPHVFAGASLQLTATAIDQNFDGSAGAIASLEAFFSEGNATQSLGVSANGSWLITAQRAGNFTFTVNATDAEGAVQSSRPIFLQVTDVPLAAWDFDTPDRSPVALAAAVQSICQYPANFGVGNLVFDGKYDESANAPTNKWQFATGQIYRENGTGQNALAGMVARSSPNEALLVRGGKYLGAQGKCLVFEFSMANQNVLHVSYASSTQSQGFSSHAWSWSTNGTTWAPIATLSPSSTFNVLTLPPITQLGNQTSAYLKVDFSGATAASGVNALDNIIFSATPITPPTLPPSPFIVISKSASFGGSSGPSSPPAPLPQVASSPQHDFVPPSTWIEWPVPAASAYQMTVYAEVVDGAVFLQAPGSILSVHLGDSIVGLAEPVSGSPRYELQIHLTEALPVPLELKFYNPETQTLSSLEQSVLFESGTTLGTPVQPVRFSIARPLPSASDYGTWINLPPDAVVISNWVDTDGDGIDDRKQPGPGLPIPSVSKKVTEIASSAPMALPTQAITPDVESTKKIKKKSAKKKKPARKSKTRTL